MSDDFLAAAESLMDSEFNRGVAEAPVEVDVEPAAAPAEPDTPELKIDAQGRAHGPDGKFVAASDENPVSAPEEDSETTIEADPEAQEADEDTVEDSPAEDNVLELDAETLGIDADHPLFTKYGGDLQKALTALAESQRLVGERAHEVGGLRKENEELQQLIAEFQSFKAMALPYQHSVDENPEGLANEIVQRAMETGDVRVLDDPRFAEAIENWGLEEPFQAAQFAAQVQIAKTMALQAAYSQPEEPSGDLAAAVEAFKQRTPDLQQVLPVMNELAEQRPVLQRALYEGNAEERALALQDLYELAKSRSTETATSEAARKIIITAAKEAEKAKSEAAVVGASRTSAVQPEAPSGDRLLEQALRDLSGLEDLVVEG